MPPFFSSPWSQWRTGLSLGQFRKLRIELCHPIVTWQKKRFRFQPESQNLPDVAQARGMAAHIALQEICQSSGFCYAEVQEILILSDQVTALNLSSGIFQVWQIDVWSEANLQQDVDKSARDTTWHGPIRAASVASQKLIRSMTGTLLSVPDANLRPSLDSRLSNYHREQTKLSSDSVFPIGNVNSEPMTGKHLFLRSLVGSP